MTPGHKASQGPNRTNSIILAFGSVLFHYPIILRVWKLEDGRRTGSGMGPRKRLLAAACWRGKEYWAEGWRGVVNIVSRDTQLSYGSLKPAGQ